MGALVNEINCAAFVVMLVLAIGASAFNWPWTRPEEHAMLKRMVQEEGAPSRSDNVLQALEACKGADMCTDYALVWDGDDHRCRNFSKDCGQSDACVERGCNPHSGCTEIDIPTGACRLCAFGWPNIREEIEIGCDLVDECERAGKAHMFISRLDVNGTCVAMYLGPPDRCPEKKPSNIAPDGVRLYSPGNECEDSLGVLVSPEMVTGTGRYMPCSFIRNSIAWYPYIDPKNCSEGPGGRCIDGLCTYGFSTAHDQREIIYPPRHV